MVGDIKSERWARSFRNSGRHRAESASLQNSRECQFLVVSAARCLCRTCTKVPSRFCANRCGPLRRRVSDAPAALKISFVSERRLFQQYRRKTDARWPFGPRCDLQSMRSLLISLAFKVSRFTAKPLRYNRKRQTLNHRVPGSSPGAPTIAGQGFLPFSWWTGGTGLLLGLSDLFVIRTSH
jgi:hypothetical protein